MVASGMNAIIIDKALGRKLIVDTNNVAGIADCMVYVFHDSSMILFDKMERENRFFKKVFR